MAKRKHPNRELREVLKDAERQGWRVIEGKKFKLKCPCADKHIKTVVVTPSNPNYPQELRRQLARATCWEEP